MVQSANSQDVNDLFSVSLIAFWVKGSISVDDSFLRINVPNTVLFGMIPAGKQKDTSPLSGVTNVYTARSYKLGAIFFGILVFILGLAWITQSIAGLIVALIGFAIFGSGIKTSFNYERSGISKTIEFPFFEANHAEELEEKLVQKLAQFQDDRNVRMQTDRTVQQNAQNTQQIVNAVNTNNTQATSNAFCSSCGAPLAADAKFCNGCGAKVN